MSKKRIRCYPPTTRDWERFSRHSLESAEHMLKAYLAGKVVLPAMKPGEGVSTGEKNKRRRRRKISSSQKLLHSMYIISQRICRKYCKGEIPHPDRVELWRKMLNICDQLEARSELPVHKIIQFRRCGLLFAGRLYDLAGHGFFIILETAPQGMANGDSFRPIPATAFNDFPVLGIKEATKIIREY